jgi:hypothetical protein
LYKNFSGSRALSRLLRRSCLAFGPDVPFSRSKDDIVVPPEDMDALLWLVAAYPVSCTFVVASASSLVVGPVDVRGGSWAQGSGYLGVLIACDAGLAKGSTRTGRVWVVLKGAFGDAEPDIVMKVEPE